MNLRIKRNLEDMSLQAGWMFADLLLALAVIFLATISFIPETKTSQQSASVNKIGKTTYKEAISDSVIFSKLYRFDSASEYLKDLKTKSMSYGRVLKPIQITLISGYNSKFENPEAASLRAIKFFFKINQLSNGAYSLIPKIIESSKIIESGSIAVETVLR